MLGVKVSLKKANTIKKYLINKDLLNNNFRMIKKHDCVIFPIKKRFIKKNVEISEENFLKCKKKKNWIDILKKKLRKKEIEKIITAHDIVGTIAIIEIPKELESKEKTIAKSLLKTNKNIKTVLKKVGEHKGIFRTQKMKLLAGKNTKETIHKENNVKIKLNVEKVFFSARLGTERKRIMKQIKKDEKIMVLFSGCAPYVCVFAKNTRAKKVVGVELNTEGHKYGLENIKLNKLTNTKLIQGNVKKTTPKLKETFDRISMQLPKNAEDFLPEAFMISKKGTIIHFYDFEHEKEFYKTEEKVNNACKKADIKYEVLKFEKCGKYGPRKFRVCLDFKIL